MEGERKNVLWQGFIGRGFTASEICRWYLQDLGWYPEYEVDG